MECLRSPVSGIELAPEQPEAFQVMVPAFPVAALTPQALFLESEAAEHSLGSGIAGNGVRLNPVQLAALPSSGIGTARDHILLCPVPSVSAACDCHDAEAALLGLAANDPEHHGARHPGPQPYDLLPQPLFVGIDVYLRFGHEAERNRPWQHGTQ